MKESEIIESIRARGHSDIEPATERGAGFFRSWALSRVVPGLKYCYLWYYGNGKLELLNASEYY